jgi:GNAT superfamily N-acetyltransferase
MKRDDGKSATPGDRNRGELAEMGLSIRPAGPGDAATIATLVYELAVYENLEHEVKGTADDFRRYLFGSSPRAEVIMAEIAGEPVGFALAFPTFSTFQCQPGLFLEDLYVRPAHRGRGIGKALLRTLARQARERGYIKMEWLVLKWNAPAIAFYRSLGARPLDGWSAYQLHGDPLDRLAAPDSHG